MNAPLPALELKDIHLPDPISWWPPALGWWLLTGGISTLLAIGWLIWHHRQKNRLRKAALAELDRLVAAYALHQDEHRLAGELSALLRRVCLSPLWTPKQTVASPSVVAGLTGQAWLQFLDQTLTERPFSTGVGQLLVSLPFQPATHTDPSLQEKNRVALVALCRSWLQIYALAERRTRSSL